MEFRVVRCKLYINNSKLKTQYSKLNTQYSKLKTQKPAYFIACRHNITYKVMEWYYGRVQKFIKKAAQPDA